MADIQYIKNVTSGVLLAAAIPNWQTTLTGMPSQNPDECVIRSITFNNAGVEDTLTYFIWSSLTNGFIGSFPGGAISSNNPGTRIRLNAPVPNVIQFRLYIANSPGEAPYPVDTVMAGSLAINMDFIKYRSIPPHA